MHSVFQGWVEAVNREKLVKLSCDGATFPSK